MDRADSSDQFDNPWQGMDRYWYWYDETGEELGPYPSLRSATAALRAHEQHLNRSKEVHVAAEYLTRQRTINEFKRNLTYAAWLIFLATLGFLASVYFSSPHR
jgi:hypothetical protein